MTGASFSTPVNATGGSILIEIVSRVDMNLCKLNKNATRNPHSRLVDIDTSVILKKPLHQCLEMRNPNRFERNASNAVSLFLIRQVADSIFDVADAYKQ